ncbi:MAG: hypothetical protein ACE5GW_02740, partial [Planctomycetota bacterium]
MSAAREAKRNYPLLLLSMVALELLLTWAHPWADPPRGFGAEESLDRGGYRYLAEARGWAQGTENDAQDGYRKPLVSIPAWLFYRLFGVNAASSRALAAIGSLGSLLLLAALLRRRHGDRIALLGAALLLLDAPWRAFVRSPAIDPWASLWLLGVLALGSGRVPWRRIASVVGLIAGATLLKPILWLGLPALLAEEGIRLARARKQSAREGARPIPPRELLAGLGTILLLLPWLWRLLKAAVGVLPEAGDPSPGSAGNGVDLLSAAPVLLPLAWVGLLLFITHVFATPGPSRPLERMAHITVWGGLVVFLASGGTPLHGLVSMTPLVVYLAAATVDRACHLDRSRPLPLRGLRGGLLVGAGVPGTLLLAYALRESSLASPFAWGTLAVAGGGVAILFGFGFPWLPVSIRRRFLLPLFLLIAVGPSLPELARMLGHP